ncbi:MAG: hypothetical protein HDT14_01700 [Oscillibacter sp.]|nr:hypothetical protein [Oscillibacter sp.]
MFLPEHSPRCAGLLRLPTCSDESQRKLEQFPEILRKGKRGQGTQGKAEDTDGLTPVKDDNAAMRFLDR